VRPLHAHDLLEIWEAGRDRHPVDRALILLGTACPELAWDELTGLSVGARDARLLSVREQVFGPRLDGFAECPRCAEGLQFGAAVADLRVPMEPEKGEQPMELVTEDFSLCFRLPNSRDLGAVAVCEDPAAARQLLVQRCVLRATRNGLPLATDALPVEVVSALARRISELDPQAEVTLGLLCPACDHSWEATFDIVTFLWQELAAYARRLLREVHALAGAYGWREADILSMSALRRRSYIEMAI
jgi:hypothetical protein